MTSMLCDNYIKRIVFILETNLHNVKKDFCQILKKKQLISIKSKTLHMVCYKYYIVNT